MRGLAVIICLPECFRIVHEIEPMGRPVGYKKGTEGALFSCFAIPLAQDLAEVEQVLVELVLVGIRDAVRRTRIDLQLGVRHQLLEARAAASIGTTWSSSPWMMSVGSRISSSLP